jgi:hypothetical protein
MDIVFERIWSAIVAEKNDRFGRVRRALGIFLRYSEDLVNTQTIGVI